MITYICFGPKKLDERKKPKCFKQAESVVALVKAAIGFEARISDEEMTEEEAEREFRKLDLSPLKHLEVDSAAKSYITIQFSGGGGWDDLAYLTQIDHKKVVEDLFDLWNGQEAARDWAERSVPYDVLKKVVVAGDMSWGDEPEGWGFETLKQTDALGIHPIVGIE